MESILPVLGPDPEILEQIQVGLGLVFKFCGPGPVGIRISSIKIDWVPNLAQLISTTSIILLYLMALLFDLGSIVLEDGMLEIKKVDGSTMD